MQTEHGTHNREGILSGHGFFEARLGQLIDVLEETTTINKVTCAIRTHVADLFATWLRKREERTNELRKMHTRDLQLTRRDHPFTYCGRGFVFTGSSVGISQQRAVENLELIELDHQRRTMREATVDETTRSSYRSLLGQLVWLAMQPRVDPAYAVS